MSKPWASGPREILEHGLFLLNEDSDRNRRLAMILIDNAVELMIKTYIGLPSRVNGLNISRKQQAEASTSFPSLLDCIEEHDPGKLDGIDLGEIEWYHRLRNELYHQGNGLTVERRKVDVYAELSKTLFSNLFGFDVGITKDDETDQQRSIGQVLQGWVRIENLLNKIAENHIDQLTTLGGRHRPGSMLVRELYRANILDQPLVSRLESLRDTRNRLVHGIDEYSIAELQEIYRDIEFTEPMLQRIAQTN